VTVTAFQNRFRQYAAILAAIRCGIDPLHSIIQRGKVVNMSRLLSSTFVLLSYGLPTFASAAFPCVNAVSSNDRSFMVLVERTAGEDGRVNTRESTNSHRVSLRVRPKETFTNVRGNSVSPATYWTDWATWSVVLDTNQMKNDLGCPLPSLPMMVSS